MWRANHDGQDQVPLALTEGILSGTPIATAQGWRAAETLRLGERVLTFEAGEQRLTALDIAPIAAGAIAWSRSHWPLRVPVGAMDNRAEFCLLPEQRVLLGCDSAESISDDPFALIPAAALLGHRGVDICRPPQDACVVRLGFAGDQIVYAGRGVLLFCPDPQLALRQNINALHAARGDYAVLSLVQARKLVARLMAEDVGSALRMAGRNTRPSDDADQAAFF